MIKLFLSLVLCLTPCILFATEFITLTGDTELQYEILDDVVSEGAIFTTRTNLTIPKDKRIVTWPGRYNMCATVESSERTRIIPQGTQLKVTKVYVTPGFGHLRTFVLENNDFKNKPFKLRIVFWENYTHYPSPVWGIEKWFKVEIPIESVR